MTTLSIHPCFQSSRQAVYSGRPTGCVDDLLFHACKAKQLSESWLWRKCLLSRSAAVLATSHSTSLALTRRHFHSLSNTRYALVFLPVPQIAASKAYTTEPELTLTGSTLVYLLNKHSNPSSNNIQVSSTLTLDVGCMEYMSKGVKRHQINILV